MYNSNVRRNERKREREEKGLCIYCGKVEPDIDKKGCRLCLDKRNINNKTEESKKNRKQYNLILKNQVIEKYGGKCVCCGESEILFLTIDHINNDGYKDSDKYKSFYYILRRNSIREDLQVLCFNCNCGKLINDGVCPHKKVNRVLEPMIDRRFNNKSQMDKNTKIDWPSNDKLVEMCNSISMNSVAKILGVCRSSLTKRLKNRKLYDLVTKRYKNKSDKLKL